uniref:Uncharacterized protein n=1 Tax=Anopheles arabiensis TaxID=7173 RepID=A0A182I441_ANOAR
MPNQSPRIEKPAHKTHNNELKHILEEFQRAHNYIQCYQRLMNRMPPSLQLNSRRALDRQKAHIYHYLRALDQRSGFTILPLPSLLPRTSPRCESLLHPALAEERPGSSGWSGASLC